MSKPFLYTAHGDNSWGDSIVWDTDDLAKCNQIGMVVSFHGWKSRRPEVGDFIEIPMKSGKQFLFKVTESKHETDPRDMFFAKGEFLGYKQDQKDLDVQLDEGMKKMDFSS